MIDYLIDLDIQLTLFLNGFHTQGLDNFIFFYSKTWVWIPFFTYLLYSLYKQCGAKMFYILAFVALIVLCSDQLSSSVIKPLVCRERPTHNVEIQNQIHTVNGYVGGLYGFVSSHAANSFAIALFLSLVIKNWLFSFTIFLWAIINSYTRIYLGVHYFGDVLCGAVVGIIIALILYKLYFLLSKKLKLPIKKALSQTRISMFFVVYVINCAIIFLFDLIF